uniref:Uncharacterized protein n=1 Tax=Aegilops tauschii subsp. strangulata TaxID=200361 RepID=A0A453K776_AEGTS
MQFKNTSHIINADWCTTRPGFTYFLELHLHMSIRNTKDDTGIRQYQYPS